MSDLVVGQNYLRFVVEGTPVPKGRPRFGKGSVYTPKRTLDQENRIREYAFLEMRMSRQRKFEGSVVVDIEVVQNIERRLDLDNVAKLCMDAMNGVVYDDDMQVDDLRVWRTIADDERTIITVSEVIDG